MSNLAPKTNSHVARLVRYLPVSAGHEQIYEEYTKESDAIDIETTALQHLKKIISTEARLIILTGDAGHGKTHLCRRLLEGHLGYSSVEAKKLLLEKCDGITKIPHADQGSDTRPLIIHKDLSEVQIADSVGLLKSISLDSSIATVICANEGRLRAIVNAAKSSDLAGRIQELFRQSFKTGLCSDGDGLHIINLNFQSTAAKFGSDGSVLNDALRSWIDDSTRWSRSCSQCSLMSRCPIYYNRQSLCGSSTVDGDSRKKKLVELFAVLERLNVVITIREMLMVVAYVITGGLVCRDVEELCRAHKRDGWQSDYAYFNLLFDASPKIVRSKLDEQIPVMRQFAKIDPGRRADRVRDDELLNGTVSAADDDIGLLMNWVGTSRLMECVNAAHGIDDISTSPMSNKDATHESVMVKKVVRSLRRKAYFDGRFPSKGAPQSIGFEFGGDFLAVLNDQMTVNQNVMLKGQLIAGLHNIQGLALSDASARLHLVDPAFGRANNGVAIIARTIEGRNIHLLPMRKRWDIKSEPNHSSFVNSVDWIDRQITVRFELNGINLELDINMMTFECINRAAKGYVSEDFYAFDLKRIRNFLGKIAEIDRDHGEPIRVISSEGLATVSIDQGLIQVGR